MPNTPALLGAGVTGLFASREVDAAGRHTFSLVVITVQRQAGKTTLLGANNIHRCLTGPRRKVWRTAQTGQDARKKWIEVADAVRAFRDRFNLPVSDRFAVRGSIDRLDDSGFIDYKYLVREIGVSDPEPDFSDPADVAATYGLLVEGLAPLGLAYLSILADPKQDLIQELRRGFGGVVIANDGFGEITTRESAQEILDKDLADAVAVGRLFLANPDLPARWRTGAELNEPDPDTFYGGGAEGYTDYPFLNS